MGTAVITATSEGRSGTASITVTPVPVASVDVSLSPSSIPVGGTASATATPRDAGGTALTGRTVTWSSGTPGVATVSASGVVTAVSVGTAVITATSEGRSGTATITVTSEDEAGHLLVTVTTGGRDDGRVVTAAPTERRFVGSR